MAGDRIVATLAMLIDPCRLRGIDHVHGNVPAHERGHDQGNDQVHVPDQVRIPDHVHVPDQVRVVRCVTTYEVQ